MKIQALFLTLLVLTLTGAQPTPTFADLQTFMAAFSAQLNITLTDEAVACFNKTILTEEFFALEVQELEFVNSTYEGTGFAEINLLIHAILTALKPAFKCLLSNGWEDIVSGIGLNSTYVNQTNLENLLYNYQASQVVYVRNALIQYNSLYNNSNFQACGQLAAEVFQQLAIAASPQNALQNALMSFIVEFWSTNGLIFSQEFYDCFNESSGSLQAFYDFAQGWARAVAAAPLSELEAVSDAYFASSGLVSYQGALDSILCFNSTSDSKTFISFNGFSFDPYSYSFQKKLKAVFAKYGKQFRSSMLTVVGDLTFLTANVIGENLGLTYQVLKNYGEDLEYL